MPLFPSTSSKVKSIASTLVDQNNHLEIKLINGIHYLIHRHAVDIAQYDIRSVRIKTMSAIPDFEANALIDLWKSNSPSTLIESNTSAVTA